MSLPPPFMIDAWKKQEEQRRQQEEGRRLPATPPPSADDRPATQDKPKAPLDRSRRFDF